MSEESIQLLTDCWASISELGTSIKPGFEVLVAKASRGVEDVHKLTYIRKDGSRLPAIVSVAALRDAPGEIIGYLFIGTENLARRSVDAEQKTPEPHPPQISSCPV